MKKIIVFLLVLCVTFSYSCEPKDSPFKEDILGHWKQVEVGFLVPPDNPFLSIEGVSQLGYHFKNNGVCEDLLGNFRIDENRRVIFEGTETQYTLRDSILMIYYKFEQEWDTLTIRRLLNDTLVLTHGDSYSIYQRVLKVEKPFEFDDVIIYSSPCYGSCPINWTLIRKNGDVIYEGVEYNTQNGLFRAKIDTMHFKQYKEAFEYVDFENMEESYGVNVVDAQYIEAFFIKDGQIVKNVSDCMNQAPAEFGWAVLPLRYLYQGVELIPIEKKSASFAAFILEEFGIDILRYKELSIPLPQSSKS